MDLNRPLVAILNEKSQIKNIVYELRYEKVAKFGLENMVVITFW
ncbi:Uncharacterised protein, partial [Mesomycoplasma hyorhinis]